MKPIPDPIGPGQESVRPYPRPAVAQPCLRHPPIVRRGSGIAETRKGARTLDTSYPPSYYTSSADVEPRVPPPSPRRSACECKGEAIRFDVLVDRETPREVAWICPDPNPALSCLRDHVAFYARPFDGYFVRGQRVTPQPGIFTLAGSSPPRSPARQRERRELGSGDERQRCGPNSTWRNRP